MGLCSNLDDLLSYSTVKGGSCRSISSYFCFSRTKNSKMKEMRTEESSGTVSSPRYWQDCGCVVQMDCAGLFVVTQWYARSPSESFHRSFFSRIFPFYCFALQQTCRGGDPGQKAWIYEVHADDRHCHLHSSLPNLVRLPTHIIILEMVVFFKKKIPYITRITSHLPGGEGARFVPFWRWWRR